MTTATKTLLLALALALGAASADYTEKESTAASLGLRGDTQPGRELYTEDVDGYSDTGYCYDSNHAVGPCALDEAACWKKDNGAVDDSTQWKDHSSSMTCSHKTAKAVELLAPTEYTTNGIQAHSTDAEKTQLVLTDATGVSVGMAVVDKGTYPNKSPHVLTSTKGTFVKAVDLNTNTITLNFATTSAIPDGTTLKLYPSANKDTCAAKFGSCYGAGGGHTVKPTLGPWSCVGGTYFYPGQTPSSTTYGPYTADEVQIGYCKSSDGNTQTGVAIPGGGYCALSADACDNDDVAVCSHGFNMGSPHISPPTALIADKAACERADDGVCVVGANLASVSTSMSISADNKATCQGKTGTHTWFDYKNGAGTTFTAAIVSKETFLVEGDTGYPVAKCYLSDLIGKAADAGTAAADKALCPVSDTAASGAARAPAVTTVTALLLAPAALLSAIIA